MLKVFVLVLFASGYGYKETAPHINTAKHFGSEAECKAELAKFNDAAVHDVNITAIAGGCVSVDVTPRAKHVRNS